MKVADVVVLTVDLPDIRLEKGKIGTIVKEVNQTHALVEFAGEDGVVYATEAIPCTQMRLRFA